MNLDQDEKELEKLSEILSLAGDSVKALIQVDEGKAYNSAATAAYQQLNLLIKTHLNGKEFVSRLQEFKD